MRRSERKESEKGAAARKRRAVFIILTRAQHGFEHRRAAYKEPFFYRGDTRTRDFRKKEQATRLTSNFEREDEGVHERGGGGEGGSCPYRGSGDEVTLFKLTHEKTEATWGNPEKGRTISGKRKKKGEAIFRGKAAAPLKRILRGVDTTSGPEKRSAEERKFYRKDS